MPPPLAWPFVMETAMWVCVASFGFWTAVGLFFRYLTHSK